MLTEPSKEHYFIPAGKAQRISKNTKLGMDAYAALGFGVANSKVAMDMAQAYGMDSAALQAPITTPAIPGLVQFLQNWLPGQVHVMTAARKIDDLVGIATIGDWSDEMIVQEVLENVGYAKPYSDYGNVPLADWNLNFVNRTVIRFELGMRVGNLEEARSARVRVNSGQSKRESCGLNLEVARNLVGFNGYNSGNDNTYGFLNDPGLSAYISVAGGGTGSPATVWSGKTFLQIKQDILTAIVQLRTQSQDTIDPEMMPLTLALPTNAVDYLATATDFGYDVWKWLKDSYPKIRVVSAPQLNTANGGAVGDGVFYLYADSVNDLSTDDGRVWTQVVPAKFMVTGVVKLAKGYEEDYVNATAGVMCKRPFAVVRYTGIS